MNVPGFTFLAVNTVAYIDRGRFQGQPTDCTGKGYPGHALLVASDPRWQDVSEVIGFVDFTTRHANCAAQIRRRRE